uniref:Tetraspanin n=1 Tax=Plectus sambesii TaxID=2011161 RepID=A0A914WLT0_9BILA
MMALATHISRSFLPEGHNGARVTCPNASSPWNLCRNGCRPSSDPPDDDVERCTVRLTVKLLLPLRLLHASTVSWDNALCGCPPARLTQRRGRGRRYPTRRAPLIGQTPPSLNPFALTVFFCYIMLVVATFVIFILFYSDTTEGLSAHNVLLLSIKRYHQNKNLADFIDYVQEQLECCGATSASQGFKDWELSEQYNCSTHNPYPERCGVPFSCCKRSVISGAAGSLANPLLPAMRSLECWQNAQEKKLREVEATIHTRGCLQPLKTAFESHAVHIGALVGGIIIPVCFSVCLANILAKQIDRQQYLLEREARRNERRKRRERHRFRDPFANVQPTPKPLTTAVVGGKTALNKAKSISTGSLKPFAGTAAEPTATFLHTETVDETKAALPPLAGDAERRRRRPKRSGAGVAGERSSRPAAGRERTGRSSRPRPSSASPVVRRRHEHKVGNRTRPDKRRKSIAVPLYEEQNATAAAEQTRRTQNWILQQSDLVSAANGDR